MPGTQSNRCSICSVTPPADKRLALFPLGHRPPINETARETLDWLDRYLGPVRR